MAGVRSSKTVGSTTYKYDTLSGKIMRQTWDDQVIDFIYDESGKPYAMLYDNTTYYYVLNVQGDVVGLLNSIGVLIAEYSYDPWGKLLNIKTWGDLPGEDEWYLSVAEVNPLRYRGYYYDTETGFYYLQTRYYDPAIGRFINADEFATTNVVGLLSSNMFAYCENNPVNRSDVNGLFAISISLALATGMFAAAALVCLMPDTQQAFADAGQALSDAYESFKHRVRQQAKEIMDKYPKSYTVYFLQDDNGRVQYVGRVKTENYASRMRYHYRTRGLTPQYYVSGLNYIQARGLEEIGIISCHTLNNGTYYNNQIHGISIFNVKRVNYLGAAEDYLANKAENALLNLLNR